MPAQGPTTLDLITLGIAVGGLVVALLSLYLTLRRDRAAGRVGVRMVVDTGPGVYGSELPALSVAFSNPERRTVTVQRAGLSVRRWRANREAFKGWSLITATSSGGGFGGMISPFSGGVLLEPGDPIYTVRAPLHRVRAACFPDVAQWVWCEDSIGGVHWERVPKQVQAAIASTKRHKFIAEGASGSRTSVEVEDSEQVDPDDLDVSALGR